MNLIDFVIIAAIVLVVGAASAYIIRAKKKGQKCIGCPYSSSCGSACHCNKNQNDTQN